MGKHFGELAFIRGIVYYRLAPHELKPFAKAISYGIPNMMTRAASRIAYWLPPMVLGAAVYNIVEESYHHSKRKNPRDFLYEVDPEAP